MARLRETCQRTTTAAACLLLAAAAAPGAARAQAWPEPPPSVGDRPPVADRNEPAPWDDAAREREAERWALYLRVGDAIREADREGRHGDSFALRRMRIEEFPEWSAGARLPVIVHTEPKDARLWIAGEPSEAGVAYFPASLLVAGAPVRIEVTARGGGARRLVDLDPGAFTEVTIDARGAAPGDPPTSEDPEVLAWLAGARARPPTATALASSPGTGEETFEAWCAARRPLYEAWRDGAPRAARAWLEEMLTAMRRLVRDAALAPDDDAKEIRVIARSEVYRRALALGPATALLVPCAFGRAPESHVDRGPYGRRGPALGWPRRELWDPLAPVPAGWSDRDPRRRPEEPPPSWVRPRSQWLPRSPLELLDRALSVPGAPTPSALTRPELEWATPRVLLPAIAAPGEILEGVVEGSPSSSLVVYASCAPLRAPGAIGEGWITPRLGFATRLRAAREARRDGGALESDMWLSLPPRAVRIVADPDAALVRVPVALPPRALQLAPLSTIEGIRDAGAGVTRVGVGLSAIMPVDARGAPVEDAPLSVKLSCETADGRRFELVARTRPEDARDGVRPGRLWYVLEARVPDGPGAPLAGALPLRVTALPDAHAARLLGHTRVAEFAPVAIDGVTLRVR